MNGVTKQITETFTLLCKKCLNADVSVSFYAGYIHDCGGDVGSLTFMCNACQAKVDVDGE